MSTQTPSAILADPPETSQTSDDILDTDDAIVDGSALPAADQRFLGRVLRFLVGISSPSYVRRARREGYTAEEHKLGWKYVRAAAGEERPLDHWFEEQVVEGSKDIERASMLQQVDAFENLWFPRMRAIIRRVVPADHREAFAGAFFKDLAQQPLGPTVVASVRTFLTRVDGLRGSGQVGAKEVLAMLETRGLTPKRIERTKALLDELEAAGAVPGRNATREEVGAAQARQREAVEATRDWFNDWATTLRPFFNAREQLALGLTVVKSKVESGEPVEEEIPAVA